MSILNPTPIFFIGAQVFENLADIFSKGAIGGTWEVKKRDTIYKEARERIAGLVFVT